MRIGLTGSMSVGKTTLAKALGELNQFKNYTIQTERSKYLRDLGIPLNLDSTYKGQIIFAAERATELMQENIITDRTVIDVMAFNNMSKSMNNYEKTLINSMLIPLIYDYDLIFYVSPKGVEIEDNGVRTIDKDYREAIDKEIKLIIKTYRKTIIEVSGTPDERVEQVKNILSSYVS